MKCNCSKLLSLGTKLLGGESCVTKISLIMLISCPDMEFIATFGKKGLINHLFCCFAEDRIVRVFSVVMGMRLYSRLSNFFYKWSV